MSGSRRRPSASAACWTPSSSRQPLLILAPVGIDDAPLLVRRKALDPRPALHVAGILGGADDVTRVVFRILDPGAETLDASGSQLEGRQMDAVGGALRPQRRPIRGGSTSTSSKSKMRSAEERGTEDCKPCPRTLCITPRYPMGRNASTCQFPRAGWRPQVLPQLGDRCSRCEQAPLRPRAQGFPAL
jgi:hypothetical protein